MSRLIFQSLALLLLVVIAITGYGEYFDYHQYYETLVGNGSNLLLVFRGLVGAAIPTLWLLFSKRFSVRGAFISVLVGIIFYGICLVSIRGGLYGLGVIILSWNSFVLFGLGVLQSVLFLAVGDSLKQRFLLDDSWSWERIGVGLALGISAQLVLLYILVLLNVLFPIVSWILLVGGVYWIRKYRIVLYGARDFLTNAIRSLKKTLHSKQTVEKLLGRIVVFLLLLSFWYILNGFELSFMPYSTAWDANHAYMFYPKMRSFNNGLYWFEPSMNASPDLWYMFLTFWFSLFRWTDGIGAISSDTIVLSLNFWSGIYVLILGGILTHTFAGLMPSKNKVVSVLGWVMILLRLTSGMGAFLVFVDNKTDLGVLTLIIGAIISGFVAIRSLVSIDSLQYTHKKALMISGFLYGIAALAKPTAMFDVINFVLYLWGMLIGQLGIIMIALLVIGVLTMVEFRGIRDYIPQRWGIGYVGAGLLAGVVSFLTANKKKLLFGITVVAIRGGAFAVTKVVIKTPYLMGRVLLQDRTPSSSELIQTFLTQKNAPSVLLAQGGSENLAGQCSLTTQGFSSKQQLYDDLRDPLGSTYNEDVIRYKGFGWKGNPSDLRRGIDPFVGTWWTGFVSEGCTVVSLNNRKDLKTLCDNHSAIQTFDTTILEKLESQVDTTTYYGGLLETIIETIRTGDDIDAVRSRINPQLQELLVFIESSTIFKTKTGEVYLPYKWIVPFNVSYNRSLQNLSSYYTDIGIIWLICFLFSIFGVVYGLVARNRIVIVSSTVTLVAWILRWFIASGIVWYSIGLIIWSILSFLALVGSLFQDEDGARPLNELLKVLFFAILGGIVLVQLFLNMIRIASQGGNGAFMWYKSSVGKQQVLNEGLQPTMKTVTGFGKDDVFAMQFPHYIPFIEAMNERNEDEGGLIAGTYIRYFVKNQSHIKYDQFLTWLRTQFSDNDVCSSYLRLQDQKIRYLAIDLNIGTVVQGEGNRSLFDRFFARVNTSTNTIEEEGTISMLIALNQQGYVSYLSSNNIGAKYAFTMPDSMFNGLSGEQLKLFKSRMSVARYFRNDTQLFDSIVQIAQQRVADGTFVTDIADILGLSIREDLLIEVIRSGQITQQQIQPLTQDERKALSQYLSFVNLQQSNPEQLTATLKQTIQQSVSNPNQILSLKVNE